MSQRNVEIVSEIHRLLNSREPSSHLVDPDLEYVNPPGAVEAGTLHGRDALNRVRDVYPDFRVEVERIVDAGEDVVVLGTARGTSASGVSVEARQGYLWTVRDGRAVRLRWFADPADALRAAGLDA